MEPDHPEARLADDGVVGELPAQAIDDLLAVAGPASHRRQQSRRSSRCSRARWRPTAR
jgi:hypothetical protein